jgi:hypothetical protein
VPWSCATLAFRAQVAEAKTEIAELEHKCTSAAESRCLFPCLEDSNERVLYDLTPSREFGGGQVVH